MFVSSRASSNARCISLHRLRAERVAHLRTIDGDLGDAFVRLFVNDVRVAGDRRPGGNRRKGGALHRTLCEMFSRRTGAWHRLSRARESIDLGAGGAHRRGPALCTGGDEARERLGRAGHRLRAAREQRGDDLRVFERLADRARSGAARSPSACPPARRCRPTHSPRTRAGPTRRSSGSPVRPGSASRSTPPGRAPGLRGPADYAFGITSIIICTWPPIRSVIASAPPR